MLALAAATWWGLPALLASQRELTLAFKNPHLRPAQPYLPYLPYLLDLPDLPLRLPQARLACTLQLHFALPPGGVPSVALQGTLGLRGVGLSAPDNTPCWRGRRGQ